MKDTNRNEEFESQENDLNIENVTNDQINDVNENEDSANLADDLEKKFADLNDSYLRLHAEFDNYRRRTMKEKADLLKTGNEKAILGVLSIVDDFERALPNIPEDAKEGVELIYSKFQNFLAQNGVKEIDSLGEIFDTDKHEAITTIPAQSEDQKDKIIDCIQKGYTLNDKVIRFPKVIVAK
ncbi:nucleotide exchange factor GrpE [Dysgonomonas sp. GY617]|uniref:nucleotide exchange factor GrpE n=1 Tax=Dysgonomonas sp. GY617 TaxID=2780420 RepID=UPI001883AF68|nr:nucleotide exchange factor GrpE [Dysgonomonas sp. GY617]MBF0574878.1 nucleotide exchange factor GrpE [Dysgonomonas sp. GY617]